MNVMFLNDAKVVRYFGTRPDLGKPIKGFVKKVTVGVRWNLPKGCYEPDSNVLVPPTVALKCVGRGKWQVLVEETYRAHVERWLLDTCS